MPRRGRGTMLAAARVGHQRDTGTRERPDFVGEPGSPPVSFEAFYRAGGVPTVMAELLAKKKVHGDALTVTGKTMKENLKGIGPAKAQAILADWPAYEGKFWKVSPTVPAAAPAPVEEKPKDEQVINENVTASR